LLNQAVSAQPVALSSTNYVFLIFFFTKTRRLARSSSSMVVFGNLNPTIQGKTEQLEKSAALSIRLGD